MTAAMHIRCGRYQPSTSFYSKVAEVLPYALAIARSPLQDIMGWGLRHTALLHQLHEMRGDVAFGPCTQPLAQVAGIDVPGDLLDL
jgi:hypothetical protein